MGTNRRWIYTFLIIFLVVCWFTPLQVFSNEKEITLTTWCGPPFSTSGQSGYLDQIITKAFEQLNLSVRIIRKPAERSLSDANLGVADGEFIRIDKVGELYPNLQIVPEHLYAMEFVAFAKRKDIQIKNGWQGLLPYKVGLVRGWKILEKNIINIGEKRVSLTDQEQLFRMLDKGRIDVAIYSKNFGLEVIKRLRLEGVKVVSSPFTSKKMYLFMHKKHSKLIPKIAKELKHMKRKGVLELIRKKLGLRKTQARE